MQGTFSQDEKNRLFMTLDEHTRQLNTLNGIKETVDGHTEQINDFEASKNKVLGASILIGALGTAVGLGVSLFEAIGHWARSK